MLFTLKLKLKLEILPRVAWASQWEEAKELTGTIVVVVDGQEACSVGAQAHVISGSH